ncbi:MAG: transposase [Myxococcales bacterium]|nr:transposase [Myxococcales bacterium]
MSTTRSAESTNGRIRAEFLNTTISLRQSSTPPRRRREFRFHYNHKRPHSSSSAEPTPAAFAAKSPEPLIAPGTETGTFHVHTRHSSARR